jgi:hypothetical protein
MTVLNAQSLNDITFREGDSRNTRTQKLEFLRRAVAESAGASRTLHISVMDGLATADPDEPLFAFRPTTRTTIGEIVATAGDAASAPTTLRLRVNGGPIGTLVFTGTTGVANISDDVIEEGELFELYPPLVADPDLDDLAISIQVALG